MNQTFISYEPTQEEIAKQVAKLRKKQIRKKRNEPPRGYGPTSGIRVIPFSFLPDSQHLAER